MSDNISIREQELAADQLKKKKKKKKKPFPF
jgi:hypothetical protein